MLSFWMLRRVAILRTAFRIGRSETSHITSATWRNIPDDGILQNKNSKNDPQLLATLQQITEVNQ
jgi:hypothetical protein